MATFFPVGGVLVIATLLLPVSVVLGGFPAMMTLERAFPIDHRVHELSQLRARDRIRHGRMLQSSNGGGVIDFPIGGTFNPFLVGLYYTTVKLGSPPREFYVQIDTGSDVLWVGCNSCKGCPQSSGLKIQLNSFDPGSSSTASVISCSDKRCNAGYESSDSSCSPQNNQCIYTFNYGDGSGSSGYYVSDLFYLDTADGDSVTSNSSASIVFGCSTSLTGELMKPDRAVDGIFGFGQQEMSVISQLSSQGIAPKVFSHCLKGDDAGGGILVLGEIVDPNIVYTPLVPSQPHYNLNLESITVSGEKLPIDPSVFATSGSQGTIVDSGTTLAYLAEGAYNSLMDAISNAVSQYANPVVSHGIQCYSVSSSTNIFPQVSLNFAGGASMVLGPESYLIEQDSDAVSTTWCIGFQKSDTHDLTILGDLVLVDKIVVYDLAGQQIGWADYDCSMSVNVSTTGTKSVNTDPRKVDSSLQNEALKLTPITIISFLMLISMLNSFW
ncbi:aspartic proteinase 36 isoform X2 [Ziziphus jujuba]|uniref:Aspartic proteinase 36 isoform X2 n=1 Tax=Ziziphus jujuba TaxID=326968 RepID=A0A6P3ZRR4_ZIZJJ|nr:aspartic proteinase 36 isoform X2 [Ziziphus jujuba]